MSFSLPVKPHVAPRTVPLLRGQTRAPRAGRSIRLAALRVPLLAKLVGANLIVVAILAAVWIGLGGPIGAPAILAVVALIALHLALVLVALRPIHDLESLASRVWHGDFGARFEHSDIADAEVLRVGSMFNILLDGLASDRARMRALAAEVIAVGDRERAAIARELHDSTAQRVAALLLQLSAAARDTNDAALARRLNDARDSAEEILEEIRLLSQTMHPALLDDLGLEAALRKLARDMTSATSVDIDVDVAASLSHARLPTNVEAVFYRVAQEAVRNATRHGGPHRVRLQLTRQANTATLDVHDDGRGFDLAQADRERRGMGLLSMRERVALVDGWLEIKTAVGSGTTISATVPLGANSEATHQE